MRRQLLMRLLLPQRHAIYELRTRLRASHMPPSCLMLFHYFVVRYIAIFSRFSALKMPAICRQHNMLPPAFCLTLKSP